MKILAIESSCDETAAAVFDSVQNSMTSVLFSQIELHQKFGGVVPEIASRSHIEKIDGVVQQALDGAKTSLADIDAVAVTQGPGLPGSLLVGLCFAKAIAYAWNKPIIPVNHLEGHIASVLIENAVPFPYLCLTASGGHTALYYVTDYGRYTCLGRTVDDAAGEAFDKVAKLLHLGYPGGPIIEQLAREGGYADTRRYPRLKKQDCNFSFSGIKTAVLYDLVKRGFYDLEKRQLIMNDHVNTVEVSSSLLVAVGDIFVNRLELAYQEYPAPSIVFVGGVACNAYLRERISQFAQKKGAGFFVPSPKYCTDNAAMIAYVGYYKAMRQEYADLTLDIAL